MLKTPGSSPPNAQRIRVASGDQAVQNMSSGAPGGSSRLKSDPSGSTVAGRNGRNLPEPSDRKTLVMRSLVPLGDQNAPPSDSAG